MVIVTRNGNKKESRESCNGSKKTPGKEDNAAENQSMDGEGSKGEESSSETKPEGISEMLAILRENLRTRKKKPAYETNLGRSVLGLAPGRIVVLEGASGAGKTSLAMNCVFEMLYRHEDRRAVVVSVDISAEELLERELARLSNVPLHAIQERLLTAEQQAICERMQDHLESVKDRMCIPSFPLDPYHIKEAVEGFKANIIVIDYIQELDYPDSRDHRLQIEDMVRTCRKWKRQEKTVLILSEVTQWTSPRMVSA